MKSQSNKLALSLQRDAPRFAEADEDGNMELSFEEFTGFVRTKLYDVQAWFSRQGVRVRHGA